MRTLFNIFAYTIAHTHTHKVNGAWNGAHVFRDIMLIMSYAFHKY